MTVFAELTNWTKSGGGGPGMDNVSNPEENYDVGYHPSPSSLDQNDQDTTETPVCSTMSADSFSYCRSNSGISTFSEPTWESNSCCSEPSPSNWPGYRSGNNSQAILKRLSMKQHKLGLDDKLKDQDSITAELEVVKERFAKLLLGEDMSGGGKGVSTAVTISNAITNLYATVFGQNLKLEPLSPDKKAMWKREMDCLLSVCDYIVEFIPGSQNLRDGTAVEVMTNRPRSDIYINLPALKKLDAMLIEILDSFEDTEFWYVERGSVSDHSSLSVSFRKVIPAQRIEEKWWLPAPCVSQSGLSEKSRKHLKHKRDCASQIHKAAMAINTSILSEMDIPEKFIASLPKSGKASIGESIYRYLSMSDKFSPEYILDFLNISTEHEALEIADRIESSMYTWRRKACMHLSKSSWDMVKEFLSDNDKSDKNTLLAERAESLLIFLKQRYPELSQTTLDTSKIQYNKDVGKAVLESYSRVLESLAFNVVAWIDDVLYADKSMRSGD